MLITVSNDFPFRGIHLIKTRAEIMYCQVVMLLKVSVFFVLFCFLIICDDVGLNCLPDRM